MYRGFFATLCMRLVGLPFYFGTYEVSKRHLAKLSDAPQPPWWVLLTAGGLGGIGFWAANYPFDFRTHIAIFSLSLSQ